MVEIKQILYPIDFSDNNRKIVPYVQMMAAKLGAGLHLLNVLRDLDAYAGFYVPHTNIEALIGEIAGQADQKMQEFVESDLADVSSVKTRVVTGDPAREIVKYAQENDIGLIVMGTHGRSGLDRAIFGSVAEKVVKHSTVPVLTVNPHHV
ncbi:MAG: universal stress protein [Proteobacteria bacterium]|nr:universal stress protein [Pseudomonadota bacterium]MBU1741931.1 universal stress protein [Pseudomonadota bacterium]